MPPRSPTSSRASAEPAGGPARQQPSRPLHGERARTTGGEPWLVAGCVAGVCVASCRHDRGIVEPQRRRGPLGHLEEASHLRYPAHLRTGPPGPSRGALCLDGPRTLVRTSEVNGWPSAWLLLYAPAASQAVAIHSVVVGPGVGVPRGGTSTRGTPARAAGAQTSAGNPLRTAARGLRVPLRAGIGNPLRSSTSLWWRRRAGLRRGPSAWPAEDCSQRHVRLPVRSLWRTPGRIIPSQGRTSPRLGTRRTIGVPAPTGHTGWPGAG